MRGKNSESHRGHRMGWLRAAVLGANDGLISISSLVIGVSAGGAAPSTVLLTGVAGLVAGALSMAAGEYISVQSQRDTEQADIKMEKRHLSENPQRETDELKEIYIKRGLDDELASRVAEKLMVEDALGAHVRDELGITEVLKARPIQASLSSAAAFAIGGIVPALTAFIASPASLPLLTFSITLFSLSCLGAWAAYIGGAPLLKGAARITIWGAIAMGLTALIGRIFGTSLT